MLLFCLVGGVGCCESGDTKGEFDATFDRFTGERVTFNEAEMLCAETGLELCKDPKTLCTGPCDRYLEYWSSSSCTLQAKISLEGTVALVHKVPVDKHDLVLKQVREYTKAFFHVVWDEPLGELLTDYDDLCDSLGCDRDSYDNLCLCTVEVEEGIVFKTEPSRRQVLDQLHIGAFPPELHPEPLQSVALSDNVIMYSRNGSYSADSIFEVIDDNGIRRYRKNLRSQAIIGTLSGLKLRFRNPPHMISIQDPASLEMHQETQAALDHYFVSIHREVYAVLLFFCTKANSCFCPIFSITKILLHFWQFVLLNDLGCRILLLDTLLQLPLHSGQGATSTNQQESGMVLENTETWVP